MTKAFRLDENAARVLVARLQKVAGKNIEGLKALNLLPREPGAPPSGAELMAKHGPTMQDMTLEHMLEQQFSTLELPPYERNYKFLEEETLRKYELDWGWPQYKFGLEVDGMVHRTKGRFKSDYDKHVLAILHGWTIMRVNGSHVRSGHVAAWVTTMMERYGQAQKR